MEYYVTLTVHRHYISTRVQEFYAAYDYNTMCVSSPDAARFIYEVESGYKDIRFDRYTAGFPAFPYPAYLEITTSVDGSNVKVARAVFSDNIRGMQDFTDVFQGSNVPQDVRVQVLKNIVAFIQKQDADGLLKVINGLIKASRNKAVNTDDSKDSSKRVKR